MNAKNRKSIFELQSKKLTASFLNFTRDVAELRITCNTIQTLKKGK